MLDNKQIKKKKVFDKINYSQIKKIVNNKY